jgi:hypothetical protein
LELLKKVLQRIFVNQCSPTTNFLGNKCAWSNQTDLYFGDIISIFRACSGN